MAIHCANVPADNPSTNFCQTISIPMMIDHLLTERNTRFSKHQYCSYLTFSDYIFVHCSVKSKVCCWHVKWQQEQQLHGRSALPTTLLCALYHASNMFPNTKVLLSIFCTLPVTNCSSERSFSELKKKTAIISNMENEHLTDL